MKVGIAPRAFYKDLMMGESNVHFDSCNIMHFAMMHLFARCDLQNTVGLII